MIRLSKRLDSIYNLIPDGSTVVDVGTDHGWLIIKTVLSGKAVQAYGLDIASGPLSHAKTNIESYNVATKIDLMQLDGLNGFTQAANVFVIAGMGAETIWGILEAYTFRDDAQIILQSNTHQFWLRHQLVMNGFRIVDEVFLFDNQKPVFILKVKRGECSLDIEHLYLGPVLSVHPTEEYLKYLHDRLEHIKAIVSYNPNYRDELNVIMKYLKEGA